MTIISNNSKVYFYINLIRKCNSRITIKLYMYIFKHVLHSTGILQYSISIRKSNQIRKNCHSHYFKILHNITLLLVNVIPLLLLLLFKLQQIYRLRLRFRIRVKIRVRIRVGFYIWSIGVGAGATINTTIHTITITFTILTIYKKRKSF